MITLQQPWLPRMKVEKLPRKRKRPQPKAIRFSPIKRFEVLHRPFDLRFRARINRWIEEIKSGNSVNFRKLYSNYEIKLINLYLYPQKNNHWLTQAEVSRRLGNIPIYRIRKRLVRSLIKIWEAVRNE